jgi:hypothetical protein
MVAKKFVVNKSEYESKVEMPRHRWLQNEENDL